MIITEYVGYPFIIFDGVAVNAAKDTSNLHAHSPGES